ncbi:Alpha carbonic anhydrase 1 [Nymphaea thermarum]|nr:Alpha carbonic anhydrase 1 [Nymphaea thermarum]
MPIPPLGLISPEKMSATLLVAGFLLLAAATANAHDAHVIFGYTGSNGPDKWGSLRPEFAKCSTGKLQSPININRSEAVGNSELASLVRDYSQTANASLVDRGFNVAVKWEEDAGVLSIDDKNYTLKSMHWHTPSEHTLDGMRFPVELHLVHESDDGSISVVAILYAYGDADPFLEQFVEPFGRMANETCSEDEDVEIPVGQVKTRSMSRGTRKYYRYVGSLTTPPCTENVIWNVLGKVRQLSKDQAKMIKSPLGMAYKNNSRPLQPLNGRKVQLYNEAFEF